MIIIAQSTKFTIKKTHPFGVRLMGVINLD